MPGHKTAKGCNNDLRNKAEAKLAASVALEQSASEGLALSAEAVCTALRALVRRKPPVDTDRECFECDVVKPKSEYSAAQWKAGVSGACKDCVTSRLTRGKATSRKASSKKKKAKLGELLAACCTVCVN